jgi:ribose transport system permease protein
MAHRELIKKNRINITGPIIILSLLIGLFSFLSDSFLSLSNAVNIIRQGSVLALAAFGQTFIILVAGIDLSVGAVMGLSSCTAALLMLNGTNVVLAVAIAILVALVCGTISGVVANYIGLHPFVATFGMWGMSLGVALVITEERVIFGFPGTLRVFHDGSMLGIPNPLIIVLIIFAALHFFLKRTALGTHVYAIGGNQEAAILSGINVNLLKTMLFAFSGLMSGIAGMLFLARSNSATAVDTIGFEFDSICAVVLGGTALAGGRGGVKETLVGVFLLATLRNGMNMMGVNIYLQLVFVGVILIFAYIAEGQRSSKKFTQILVSMKAKRKENTE